MNLPACRHSHMTQNNTQWLLTPPNHISPPDSKYVVLDHVTQLPPLPKVTLTNGVIKEELIKGWTCDGRGSRRRNANRANCSWTLYWLQCATGNAWSFGTAFKYITDDFRAFFFFLTKRDGLWQEGEYTAPEQKPVEQWLVWSRLWTPLSLQAS